MHIPVNTAEIQQRCENLKIIPGPPPSFNKRSYSDRALPRTKPTLIKNGTIWTGAINGLEILKGDILLDKGLIKAVGRDTISSLKDLDDYEDLDAKGSWVTPGYGFAHIREAIFRC